MCLTHTEPLLMRRRTPFALALETLIFELDVHEPFDTADVRYLGELAMIDMFAFTVSVPFLQAAVEIVCAANFSHAEVRQVPEYVYEARFLIRSLERL